MSSAPQTDWGSAFLAHRKMLLSVARRIVGENDAEDAVQSAFLHILQSNHPWEGRSRLHTWLVRCVINNCLMIRRGKGRRAFGEEAEPLSDTSPARGKDPEAEAEQSQLFAKALGLIERLPPCHRNALREHYLLERSYREIGEARGTSLVTQKVHCYRGLQRLKEAMT